LWFFFYHPPSYTQLHGKKSSKIAELKKVDWTGVTLLVAGLALFLLGISWGGPAEPWSSPRILGLLLSGAVAIIAFILYEVFLPPVQPIVPMRFFRDIRGFTCLEVISATYGVINIALFVMWPQQVVYIFGSTVSSWEETAWLSTTAAFGLWGGIVILGPLMSWIGHIRYQILVSSIWMTAFLGAMASITVENKARAIAFSFLAGWTIGWGEVIAAIVVQYVVSDQDLGVAFCKFFVYNLVNVALLTGDSCDFGVSHYLRFHLYRRIHCSLYEQSAGLPCIHSTATRFSGWTAEKLVRRADDSCRDRQPDSSSRNRWDDTGAASHHQHSYQRCLLQIVRLRILLRCRYRGACNRRVAVYARFRWVSYWPCFEAAVPQEGHQH